MGVMWLVPEPQRFCKYREVQLALGIGGGRPTRVSEFDTVYERALALTVITCILHSSFSGPQELTNIKITKVTTKDYAGNQARVFEWVSKGG